MNYIGTERLYSATELGAVLGISACKVGRIANQIGLKCEEFGAYFKDKCRNSFKEIETFRYNSSAIDVLRQHITC